MQYKKVTSWFLAISMFLFGILKFVSPFKDWYSVQIATSGLGEFSYVMGILGEIVVGSLLILVLLYKRKIRTKTYKLITNSSFSVIILMMLTGIYVHLHPDVPAEVLPLKIKPPYIPLFFICLALSNILLFRKTTGK